MENMVKIQGRTYEIVKPASNEVIQHSDVMHKFTIVNCKCGWSGHCEKLVCLPDHLICPKCRSHKNF